MEAVSSHAPRRLDSALQFWPKVADEKTRTPRVSGSFVTGPSNTIRAMFRSLHFLLPAVLLVTGCRTVHLSDASRDWIHVVSVGEHVVEEGSFSGSLIDLPTRGEMYYLFWFTIPIGVIYDLIDSSENARRRSEALAQQMRQADVHVGDIMRRQFMSRLSKEEVFDAVLESGGDARFRLEVEYGLADRMGLRGWKPWVEVEVTLLDLEGEVLWRKAEKISDGDPNLPEFVWPFSKPERLRRAYAKAARMAAARLVEHLKGAG